MHCPYDQGNPKNCPLHAMRLTPMPARMQWVRKCTDLDLRSIVRYHFACISTKEQARPRPETAQTSPPNIA